MLVNDHDGERRLHPLWRILHASFEADDTGQLLSCWPGFVHLFQRRSVILVLLMAIDR